jgi:hypothetical protein
MREEEKLMGYHKNERTISDKIIHSNIFFEYLLLLTNKITKKNLLVVLQYYACSNLRMPCTRSLQRV